VRRVYRGRPSKHRYPPGENLVSGRQVRQVEVRKHIRRALLRCSKLALKAGERRSPKRDPDGKRDMIRVEASRKLRGGATDDP
jgi:hypothetical protein